MPVVEPIGIEPSKNLWATRLRSTARFLFPLAFVPFVLAYAWESITMLRYSFAPFLFLAILGILPGRLRELGELQAGSARGLWLCWGFAMLCGLIAVVAAMPWWGTVGAMFVVLGAAHAWGGPKLLQAVVPLWCCLWMAIRPPLNFDLNLIQGMQLLTVQLGTRVLDALGQLYLISGHVIYLSGKEISFEAACGGAHWVFSCWAFAWLLCLIRHGTFRHWLVLMALVPLWVLFVNTGSLVLVVLLWTTSDLALDVGWNHELFLGGQFLAMSLFALSTEQLIEFLTPYHGRALDVFEVRDAPRRTPEVSAPPLWPAWEQTPAAAPEAIFCGVVLFTLQLVSFLTGGLLSAAVNPPPDTSALRIKSMSVEIAGRQQRGFDAVARHNWSGKETHCLRWFCAAPSSRAVVMRDSPCSGWHDLNRSYIRQGWRLVRSAVQTIQLGDPVKTTAMISADDPRRRDDLHGRLRFDLVDSDGKPAYEPDDPLSLGAALRHRLKAWTSRIEQARFLLVRVCVGSSGDENGTQRDAVRKRFETVGGRATTLCLMTNMRGG